MRPARINNLSVTEATELLTQLLADLNRIKIIFRDNIGRDYVYHRRLSTIESTITDLIKAVPSKFGDGK